MNSNEFIDDFIDDVLIDGLNEENVAYQYFVQLVSKPKYAWLNDILNQRKQQISEIDRNDLEYKTSLENCLKGIPYEDDSVRVYAQKEFDILWSKKGRTL